VGRCVLFQYYPSSAPPWLLQALYPRGSPLG
jgi:hypothetical protein